MKTLVESYAYSNDYIPGLVNISIFGNNVIGNKAVFKRNFKTFSLILIKII